GGRQKARGRAAVARMAPARPPEQLVHGPPISRHQPLPRPAAPPRPAMLSSILDIVLSITSSANSWVQVQRRRGPAPERAVPVTKATHPQDQVRARLTP